MISQVMTTVFREIEFENNSPKVCYSGQLLKGRVKIYFPVDTHVKEIYITFCGNGFCQWSDSVDGEPITGSKSYLNERVDLIQKDSHADIILPAGNHQYEFEVQFRPRLPTSYEGTYGYIRYITTLQIDRSAKKLHPLTETFTVINPLNLDNNSSYGVPMEVRKCTKFNQFCLLFCWTTGDMEIFGRLPVRGYCSGQMMNLKLDVVNRSCQDILYFSVQFVQEITYTANNGQQKVECIVLSTKKTEGCKGDRHGLQSIKVNTLVPSLPPTNFSADVCGSRYKFVVIAQTTMCHRNPTFEIPVVIGTYPISNELYSSSTNATSQTTFLSSAPSFDLNSHGSDRSINSSPDLPPYPDADPPTYEEAIRSSVVAKSQKSFVPNYPTYRRQTSYASEEP